MSESRRDSGNRPSEGDALERHLRAYYGDRQLSAQRVQRIRAGGRSVTPLGVSLGAAAALMAVAVTGVLVHQTGIVGPGPDSHPEVAETVQAESLGGEIAYNHTNYRDPERRADSFEGLAGMLGELGVSVREPEPSEGLTRGLSVLGGRFCSLGGQKAIQVHLERGDSSGRASLYITAAEGRLAGIDRDRFQYDGTEIEVWTEDGVVYALAE